MKALMNKRCPKCGGNIFLENDSFGCYEHCLQCGYDCNLENNIESPEPVALSGISSSKTQVVKKLTSIQMVPELLARHMAAELD
jgi:uncharacterized protein (DUF983 family)